MPENDLIRVVDNCVSDTKLVEEEDSDCLKIHARRGRPPRTLAKASPSSKKIRQDEDVCFVCFDGGTLVLCDRRGCPKVYHPACVKRTEAFFRSRSKWNCGWHICTTCQKDSFYMCYTCPYSVCKKCVRSSDYVVVKESKGFCGICMKTIMLIENVPTEANVEKVQVDFDDQGSWEYLFKIYWVSLKEKLSLTLEDLTNAKNPWKYSASKRRTSKDDDGVTKPSRGKIMKMENIVFCERLSPLTSTSSDAWATDELLDFVGYMKNGDISVLSKYDVQRLVLEHVKQNNLENASQDSEIMCDTMLMTLFRKDRVDHLEMLKLLDSHLLNQERSPVTETISFQVDASKSCDRLHEQRIEGESHQVEIDNIHVRPSSSDSRNHSVVVSGTSAALDADMIWLYGDPDGKIHGPFSLLNLQQWNSTGHFPPELRIWRLSEHQKSSILLTDALKGKFNKTVPLQNHSILKQEGTATKAYDENKNVVVGKLESRVLDFSPNSVSTDQSVISTSNSVITRNSDPSHNVPLEFTLCNEREAMGSVSHWNQMKVESPLLGQSPISCSLSLATLPRNSNCSLPQPERWNLGQTEVCNRNDIGLSGAAEKQVTATVQSCGQNWNAATPSSASNAWDSNSGVVTFTYNQEIDFLDLFNPTFKFNFSSNTTTTNTTDWQPIVTGPYECDESVSDLLAEVEAMESQKRLASSTFRHSIHDSFSPDEGHSISAAAVDVNKGDSMSSTNELHMMHHSQTNSAVGFWPFSQ